MSTASVYTVDSKQVIISPDHDDGNNQQCKPLPRSQVHEKTSKKKYLLYLQIFIVIAVIASLIVGIVLIISSRKERGNVVTEKPIRSTASPTVTSERPSHPNLGKYRYAAVAADSAPCSTIGSTMLARGGSAVDAAIAALICNGAVNMHSMGIGGGFFMLIYDRYSDGKMGGKWRSLNAREVAPIDATDDMFVEYPLNSTLGGKAIAVPGEISGYWSAHQKYGRLEWSHLFQPTIDLLEEGFSVTRAVAAAAVSAETHIRGMQGLRELLVRNDGDLVKEGDILVNRKLAATLRMLANGSVEEFYNGSLTDDIVQDIQDAGGIITKEDLANYEPKWDSPLTVNLQNGGDQNEELTVHTMGLSSGGPVYAFILNTMDGFNLTKDDVDDTDKSVLTYHRIAEAYKYAFAMRTRLGDHDELKTFIENATSEDYTDSIRNQIDDSRTFSEKHYLPEFSVTDGIGTSHLSVLAADGSAVSVTSTINSYFGSKVRGLKTGIIFNNEMDDFSTPNLTNALGIPPSPYNTIRPGKRPQSSMSPSIITNSRTGNVILVNGASGGPKIITATAWTTMHSIWLGKSVNDAVEMARFHHQLSPNKVQYEKGIPSALIEGLKKKGHNVTMTSSVGIMQAIRTLCGDISKMCIQATCDSRKGGRPDGF